MKERQENEEKRIFFIRYSPSFGMRGTDAYRKFKEWEITTGLPNLTYYYDKDNALVIREMTEEEVFEKLKNAK